MLCLLLVVIIIIIAYNIKCKEGLVSRPLGATRQKYINDILNNKNMFDKRHTYYSAREKMPWLDAIIYEEVRHLARQNNLNKNSLNTVF